MLDPLGDRMKAFERAGAPAPLNPAQPVYARIDGRGFSRFTRDMDRPFDARMTRAMQATAAYLLEATHARAAFVQSDEISLLWQVEGEGSELFFGGKPLKMVSVLSGMATAAFTKACLEDPDGLSAWVSRLPHFDARVCQMPDRTAACEMFAWRGQDARRNGINQLARAHFSHRQLQNQSTGDIVTLLGQQGIRLDAQPPETLNGTLLRRVLHERRLEPAELERIPQAHRPDPDQTFLRAATESYSAAHPGWLTNLEAVLFENAAPCARD